MSKPERIVIDDVEYVRKDSVPTPAINTDGLKYCVVRTYSAGVHIGYLESLVGQTAHLVNSRRLWQWDKAASLSQVAMEGCNSSKFAMTLPEIILTDVIEVIACSKKAQIRLGEIPEWKA